MGQFGSLYDRMHWSARNHNLFTAVNYEVSPKLSLFGNFVWNDGRGSLGGIDLNPKQATALPAGYNYAAISEIGRFSALNAARHQHTAGLAYRLRPDWQFTATYYFARYQDRSPYLMDTTGRTRGVEAGFSYTF